MSSGKPQEMKRQREREGETIISDEAADVTDFVHWGEVGERRGDDDWGGVEGCEIRMRVWARVGLGE